jgi:putative ABC transport system permease protein
MKKWLEPVKSAWLGVITHKLRSFLTMLGIIIGVGAVIALMSIGKGTEAQILNQIESLGSNLIIISPGSPTGFGGIRGGGSVQTLTLEDAEAISGQVHSVEAVSTSYSSNSQLIVGKENMNSQVNGVTPAYAEVFNIETSSGVFFSDYDYKRGSKVAVIGSNVADTLFPSTLAIGQEIRMGNNIVTVMGVMDSDGASMMGMGASDDSVLIPLTAMQQMFSEPRTSRGERVVSSISLTVAGDGNGESVVEEVTTLLRIRHQLSLDAEDDFRITSLEEIIGAVSDVMGVMTLFLGAVAAISLLVGGIGVMNIMLVSVLERTREIGIRKALGARERDIWSQFLLEASFLSFGGGMIGIALGWTASVLVNKFVSEINTIVTADIVILAVSVSVGIGLFFGFYPAWNASRLKPIEALRAE